MSRQRAARGTSRAGARVDAHTYIYIYTHTIYIYVRIGLRAPRAGLWCKGRAGLRGVRDSPPPWGGDKPLFRLPATYPPTTGGTARAVPRPPPFSHGQSNSPLPPCLGLNPWGAPVRATGPLATVSRA